MHNIKPSLSFILFLVFIIHTASAADDVVYDVSGNKVLNNVPYHIGPVVWAKGGGIKLTDKKNNNKICPYNVVQDPAEVNIGGKFSFTQVAKAKYLRTSYPIGIDSGNAMSKCDASTFWQIDDAEAKAPKNFITTGGSFDTAASCFQIVHYPKPTSPKIHSYMLQHCPYFCGAGPHTCFNVSLVVDNGVRYLASSGTPFEFVFKKSK
nr:proteinase inhibitor I3 [Tanacetum cinerariifolium]